MSSTVFPRIWQHIEPTTQPCVITLAKDHLVSSQARSQKSRPDSWWNSWFAKQQFLHKLSVTVSGKLICMLISLTRVLTSLQFWDGKSRALATPWANPISWYQDGDKWASRLQFTDRNSKTQRYSNNTVLGPIVTPFIRCHHLMLQHDKAQPHFPWICTQFFRWKCSSSCMACRLGVWGQYGSMCLMFYLWRGVAVPQATNYNVIGGVTNAGRTRYWLSVHICSPKSWTQYVLKRWQNILD